MPALRTSNGRTSNIIHNERPQKIDIRHFTFESVSGEPKAHSSGDATKSGMTKVQPSIEERGSGNEITSSNDGGKIDHAALASSTISYPTGNARSSFRRKDGKKVTPHQWAVYDFILKIPCGNVSTYKHICDALGEGSPRSVGSALRNNPFAPFVPCHRVIASNFCLGGFMGEWGTEKASGSRCGQKLEMLSDEGLEFTSDGKLRNPERFIWRS